MLVPAPKPALLEALNRDLAREGVGGRKGAEPGNLIGAMGVDSGEDQKLPVKALAFLLLSCQHSFASGLLLLPDTVPALGIAFLVFPPRLVRPFPRQDLVVLFLKPRINLRLQPNLGLRPIRRRLHKHPRAARPLRLLEELRKRLVLRLRRRPQAHHHPIGQRQRDYHYQCRAKHPRQLPCLLFHAQYYTKNSVHPTTGIILRQSTLETGTSAQARRTKKKNFWNIEFMGPS